MSPSPAEALNAIAATLDRCVVTPAERIGLAVALNSLKEAITPKPEVDKKPTK